MKIVKRALSIVLLLTFMLSTVSFAVTSSGYGNTVTMYAPDGRSIVVSIYDVPNWKAVGWYDYPVTIMYAPDGRQEVIYSGDVWKWKNVGWYDYPVTVMYAPDGRQMVIYTGDVPAWEAVGWFTYPVNSNVAKSNPYYPNTDILSYEPYGNLFSQDSETLANNSVNLFWGYETTVSQANRYIEELEKHGYYQESFEDHYDYELGDYVIILYKKDSNHTFRFEYYYDYDVAYVSYILY